MYLIVTSLHHRKPMTPQWRVTVALGLEFGNCTHTCVTRDRDTTVLPIPMSHPTHRCWIPAVQNIFSSLAPFGFNFFDMLVPDFMHLVRILVSHGDGTIQEFIDDIGRFPPLEGPLFTASLKMHH